MTTGAGVLRSADSLAAAGVALDAARAEIDGAEPSVVACELGNLVTLGSALLTAARWREESRGAHTRSDFPDTEPTFRRRAVVLPGA